MTDKKQPKSRKLVAQKVGAVDKRRRPRGLTRAIRTAIDAIIFDRCTREEACKRAGITERAMYLGLEKPEVARHWNSQLVVLRRGESAANVHALAGVRDESGNAMAKVAAVKVLEQLDNEAAQRSPAGSVSSPGLTIVIQHAASSAIERPGQSITIDAAPIPAARQPAIAVPAELDHAPACRPEHEDDRRLAPAGMLGIADATAIPPLRKRRRS